jgi:hypothetical protein
MILRSRKNRPTTARNARGAKGRKRDFTFGGLLRAVFFDRRLAAVALAAAVSLAPGLELSAAAPSGDSAGRRASANSSLRWRSSGTRTTLPTVRQGEQTPAARPDEGPGLLDADQAARPLPADAVDGSGVESAPAVPTLSHEKSSTEQAPAPWPRRDNSIRLAQAVQPMPRAEEDPFGDSLRRLGTPAQGAPPTVQPVPGTTQQQAPRPLQPTAPSYAPSPLPSTGQLAVGGGGFLEEKCPELSDLKKINAITNNVTAQPGELPRECFFDTNVLSPSNRAWMTTNYMWKASGMCHKPLYFEQIALERYGHSTGKYSQPFVDAAHFFLTVPVLPYKMGVELPWECKYALGYYRPGSCAPYIIPPVPLSARGAALEAATAAALIYTLP